MMSKSPGIAQKGTQKYGTPRIKTYASYLLPQDILYSDTLSEFCRNGSINSISKDQSKIIFKLFNLTRQKKK